MNYVVYLTSYKGNKLPMFYIGSTTLHKIKSGYNGSVLSKEYKEIFRKERLENKHLFLTKVIASFNTRLEAQRCEKRLQEKLNVVRSSMYINKSVAKDFGWFGMNTKGELSPVYGKRWSLTSENKQNISKAQKEKWKDEAYVKKMSNIRKGKWHRPSHIIKEQQQRKQEIINLYNTKSSCIKYGYVCKNGKIMSYEQAFSLYYAPYYKITPQAIRMLIR